MLLIAQHLEFLILKLVNYSNHIFVDPNIRFGRPCIKMTRISVHDVLVWLADGMTHEQIISDHPELSEQSIRACLAFAADREHKYKIAL